MIRPHITILGGGPAGLAVGYYARKHDLPFTLYEAASCVGGNCVTYRHNEFFFDSGAHRFHDKIPEITEEMKTLIGEDFRKIDAPSSIYYRGKFIDFPLSPFNLIRNLGFRTIMSAGINLLASRIFRSATSENFEQFALYTYGKKIADLFLLGYSQKLWGLPSFNLSPKIAARRMKGLTLRVFLIEALFGQKAKTEHLEGSFYYPTMGIGTIPEKLAAFCGKENIRVNKMVTKIIHDENRICAIEFDHDEKIQTDFIVSTLPLDYFLKILEPPPGEDILQLARSLQYRDMLLVALFLNRNRVSENATIYFPDPALSFTRIHEPKNRSQRMSPPRKTALIVEIPCQRIDSIWEIEDEKLIQQIISQLIQSGLIKKQEIIDAFIKRMLYAYPILEIGYEEKIQKINYFLTKFYNLRLSGRNSRFFYGHIHDMMNMANEIIEGYLRENG